MSDDSNINYSVAEKFSYAYVDGKYAKIAVSAGGSAILADPLTWSYAETHSYVKVDPDSLGVEVPSGVTEIYAKVLYIPGVGGGSSGGSSSEPHTHPIADITGLNTKLNSLSSAIDANLSEIDQLSITVQNISIPTKLSDLSNDSGFITSAFVKDYVSGKIDEVIVPYAVSQLSNDSGFITDNELSSRFMQYDDSLKAELSSSLNVLSTSVSDRYTKDEINHFLDEISLRVSALEAELGKKTELSDRSNAVSTDNIILDERSQDDNNTINYGERI